MVASRSRNLVLALCLILGLLAAALALATTVGIEAVLVYLVLLELVLEVFYRAENHSRLPEARAVAGRTTTRTHRNAMVGSLQLSLCAGAVLSHLLLGFSLFAVALLILAGSLANRHYWQYLDRKIAAA